MASTILSDDDHEHGQLFYQYCICVYVKAIFHLYQKPRAYKDPRINAQFLKSKKLYETYTFRALGSLNFVNAPTLPFVQALISAVSRHSFFDKQVFLLTTNRTGIFHAVSWQHEPILDSQLIRRSSDYRSRLS